MASAVVGRRKSRTSTRPWKNRSSDERRSTRANETGDASRPQIARQARLGAAGAERSPTPGGAPGPGRCAGTAYPPGARIRRADAKRRAGTRLLHAGAEVVPPGLDGAGPHSSPDSFRPTIAVLHIYIGRGGEPAAAATGVGVRPRRRTGARAAGARGWRNSVPGADGRGDPASGSAGGLVPSPAGSHEAGAFSKPDRRGGAVRSIRAAGQGLGSAVRSGGFERSSRRSRNAGPGSVPAAPRR